MKPSVKGNKQRFLPRQVSVCMSHCRFISLLFPRLYKNCQLLKKVLEGFLGRKKTLSICPSFCLSTDGGKDSVAFYTFRPGGLQPHWPKSVCTVIPILYHVFFNFYSLKSAYENHWRVLKEQISIYLSCFP